MVFSIIIIAKCLMNTFCNRFKLVYAWSTPIHISIKVWYIIKTLKERFFKQSVLKQNLDISFMSRLKASKLLLVTDSIISFRKKTFLFLLSNVWLQETKREICCSFWYISALRGNQSLKWKSTLCLINIDPSS